MTKAIEEIIKCKRDYFTYRNNGELIRGIIPVIMNAFKTKKFSRRNAIEVAASIIAMIENFDGETDECLDEIDNIEMTRDPVVVTNHDEDFKHKSIK